MTLGAGHKLCTCASCAGTLWKKSDHLETGQVPVTASPCPACPQRSHLEWSLQPHLKLPSSGTLCRWRRQTAVQTTATQLSPEQDGSTWEHLGHADSQATPGLQSETRGWAPDIGVQQVRPSRVIPTEAPDITKQNGHPHFKFLTHRIRKRHKIVAVLHQDLKQLVKQQN